MPMLELALGVTAALLGFGAIKFLPRIASKAAGALATLTIAVMFWNMLGLPAVELLNNFTQGAVVMAVSIGYLAGERIGSFWS